MTSNAFPATASVHFCMGDNEKLGNLYLIILGN
jgi:hypothetical protein